MKFAGRFHFVLSCLALAIFWSDFSVILRPGTGSPARFVASSMALVGAWYLVPFFLPVNHVVYAGAFLLVICWQAGSRNRAGKPLSPHPGQHLHRIHLLTHAVARSETIEMVYEEALNALERSVKADRASVLVFDASGLMRFKAWRGLSEEYRQAVEGHSPWASRRPEILSPSQSPV